MVAVVSETYELEGGDWRCTCRSIFRTCGYLRVAGPEELRRREWERCRVGRGLRMLIMGCATVSQHPCCVKGMGWKRGTTALSEIRPRGCCSGRKEGVDR